MTVENLNGADLSAGVEWIIARTNVASVALLELSMRMIDDDEEEARSTRGHANDTFNKVWANRASRHPCRS